MYMASETLTVLYAGAFPGWSQRDNVIKLGLEQQGHQVTEVQSYDIFSRRRQRELVDRFSSRLLLLLYVSMIFAENVVTVGFLLLNTRQVRDADVLFSANASDYSVFAVKLIGFLYGKPVAFDPHGGLYYPNVLGRQFINSGSLIARLYYTLDKKAAHFVDTYIVFTEAMKAEYSDFFEIPKEKIVVVYTGVDENRLEPVEKTGKLDSEVDILYWGTYISFHGTSVLLEVAKELNDKQFVFLGTGGVRKSLIETVQKEDIQNVSFEGYVSESTLFEYINEADIVCNRFQSNPYGDIGIGNKAAEASFMSKVMLSAKSPGLEELFTDGESALLFEPGCPEAAVRRVTRFYEAGDRDRIESNVRQIYDCSLRPEVGAGRLIEDVIKH